MARTTKYGFRAITTLAVVIALGLLGIQFSATANAVVTDGECADNSGLNVVADFQELGGGVQVRCVENWGGGTALNAFGQAFSLTGTNRWGLAFICRVNGKPNAAQEDCIDTPPADAYWSYWVSTSGGWGYSGLGVANRNAKAGEWHGLSFSKNRTASTNPAPRVNPAVPPAPAPKPKPSETSKPPAKPKPKPSKTSKPTSKPSQSTKPRPSTSSSAKPEPGSSATNKPRPTSSSTNKPKPGDSTTSPSPSTNEPGADPKTPDDTEESEKSGADAETSDDKETPTDVETSGAEDPTDFEATTESPATGDVSDSASEKTGSEKTGPPTGTILAIAAIALLAAAAFIRHRFRARGNPGDVAGY